MALKKEGKAGAKKAEFPPDEKIEVVSQKGDKVYKKTMTYKEYQNLEKKKGWKYSIYQFGFCSVKENH